MKLDLAKIVLPYLPHCGANCVLKSIETAEDPDSWYLRYRNLRLGHDFRTQVFWLTDKGGPSKLAVRGRIQDVIPIAGREALELVLPQLNAILQIISGGSKRLYIVEGTHMLDVRSIVYTGFTMAQTEAIIAKAEGAEHLLLEKLSAAVEQVAHDAEHLMRYKEWLRRRRMH